YYLLILNNYKSHYSANFKRYYKENKIIMLYILAHISYLLQPLNIRYFRPLKKAYSREIKYLIRYFITYIFKTKFFSAFYIIFKAIFIKSNI
ncbi:hypothetical protein FOC1_g10000149, partial [Fusarium oxysporum f. sp. cubense race 1]